MTPRDEDLERWIAAFRGPLVGLVTSWGADWRGAEELAQDTFAVAWLARARFRGEPEDLAAVGAWLRGIAWNRFLAEGRRSERSGSELGSADAVASPTEPDERRAELEAAFAKLSSPHQSILRMHYLEETGTAEVAALLGLTPKAVEGRLYQARRALREIVERHARMDARGART